jgi:hypothetical protein
VNPLLINLLVKACPEACLIQDEDEMTPLHIACDKSCQLFDDDSGLESGPPSYDTIRALLVPSLEVTTLEGSSSFTEGCESLRENKQK